MTMTRLIFAIVISIVCLHCLANAFFLSQSRGLSIKNKTQSWPGRIVMHLHHDHSHSHHHGHDHRHENFFQHLVGIVKNPKAHLQKPKGKALLIATAVLIISGIIRRKLTRVDFLAFASFTTALSIFDVLKTSFKDWLGRAKLVKDGIVRHSTPFNRNYLFNNNNLADRVTLLGVAINILLSVTKFFGGIVFNSAVLVADAGHSLSDLFSDFITLWAVQIARIPPDSDHPYGHGKFESVGSLFLSLTLLATGLSVGTWSYHKMLHVLAGPKGGSVAMAIGGHAHAHAHSLSLPSPPALGLALLSIVSKEWLFRVTKRVGESLNSQILIANAWHHRSDSFSSVLSLLSIAAAIFLPGFLVLDPMGGILLGGMICLTGGEVLVNSVKELTDSSNEELVHRVYSLARGVNGVRGVRGVKTRPLGGGYLVEMKVVTDAQLSSSATHVLGERVRWEVLDKSKEVLDVLVRTQPLEGVVCPLLSKERGLDAIEKEVQTLLLRDYNNSIDKVKRVTVHYVSPPQVMVEVLLNFKAQYSREELEVLGKRIRADMLKLPDIVQVEVQLDLNNAVEDVAADSSTVTINAETVP